MEPLQLVLGSVSDRLIGDDIWSGIYTALHLLSIDRPAMIPVTLPAWSTFTR